MKALPWKKCLPSNYECLSPEINLIPVHFDTLHMLTKIFVAVYDHYSEDS